MGLRRKDTATLITVVFENRLATALEEWDAVAPVVVQRARTVRYDRRRAAPAGQLPGRTAADLAHDLEVLLKVVQGQRPNAVLSHFWSQPARGH